MNSLRNKIKLSKISKFLILGIVQNRKPVFLLGPFYALQSFLLSPILNLKLQLLSKFEVKENFRDFWVFDFGYRAKSKTRKPWKFLLFLLKPYWNFEIFVSVHFLSFLNLKLQLLAKFELKGSFSRFPSFWYWV